MAVSTITQIMYAQVGANLAAFNAGGVLYTLWSVVLAGGRRLFWRPHTVLNESAFPTPGNLVAAFMHFTAAIRPSDGTLLVAYDDANNSAASEVWLVGFNVTTGAVVFGPTSIDTGIRPSIIVPTGGAAGQLHLVYVKNDVIFIRTSWNNGATWSQPQPVLNNKVLETTDLVTVPFDSGHVSVLQVGRDARSIYETGYFNHSRPLGGAIVRHPTLDDRFFVVESAQRQVLAANQLADNLRGALHLVSSTQLLIPDRFRQGVDDGVGDLILLDTNYWSAVVNASLVVSAGAAPGAGLVSVAIGPPLANGALVAALGATNAAIVDSDQSSAYAYFCGYTDVTADGGLAVVRLADLASAAPVTGIRCRAVGVGPDPTGIGATVVALATQEAGIERLRIYTENGLAPTFQASHKLPARANSVLVQMTSATVGRIYVATDDRILCYEVNGLTAPIRLVLTIFILTRGNFYHLMLLPSGNILAAMGNGGVGIYSTTGEVLAQTRVSGVYAEPWRPGKVFAAGALVQPTSGNPYAPLRHYFKTTLGGTSGTIAEPPWAATGSVVDGSVTWVDQGVMDGVVADVTYDEKRRRLYAVGTVNGPAGLSGRVWTIGAPTFLVEPAGYTAPALKPNPPVGIQAVPTPGVKRSITVTWVNTPGTTGVRVFKSNSGSGPFVQIYQTLAGDPGSYVDADPTNTNNATYYYTVAIQTAGGWSDQSYVAYGTTPLDPQPAVLDANTVGLWRFFNAPLGVSPDLATPAHDLTFVGNAALVNTGFFPAPNNNALSIPGAAGDAAASGVDPTFRSVVQGVSTYEVWVYPGDLGAWRGVFTCSNNGGAGADELLSIYINNGQIWAAANGVNVQLTGAIMSAGVWQHLAIRKTFVAGTTYLFEVFRNGIKQGAGANVGNGVAASQEWAVGTGHGRNYPFVGGKINDVRFSNVARSDAEILATYNRALGTW